MQLYLSNIWQSTTFCNRQKRQKRGKEIFNYWKKLRICLKHWEGGPFDIKERSIYVKKIWSAECFCQFGRMLRSETLSRSRKDQWSKMRWSAKTRLVLWATGGDKKMEGIQYICHNTSDHPSPCPPLMTIFSRHFYPIFFFCNWIINILNG